MAGGQWALLLLTSGACVTLGAVAMWLRDAVHYGHQLDEAEQIRQREGRQ